MCGGEVLGRYLSGQFLCLSVDSECLHCDDKNISYTSDMKGFEVHAEYVSRSGTETGLFRVNSLCYPGSLYLKKNENASNISVSNGITLSQLLYGSLSNQMPIGWPIEALKVQAILSRSMTFLEQYILPYGDLSNVYEQSVIAVDETDGLILSDKKENPKFYEEIYSSIPNNYNINRIYDLAIQGLSAQEIVSEMFPDVNLVKISIGSL